VAHDVLRKARDLVQRGLDHYARGRFRESVLAWQDAAALAPKDPRARSLLAFARRRLNERETRPVAAARHDTLESPIPGYLASLTVVEAEENGSGHTEGTAAEGEWAQVDTRRVLGGTSEVAAQEAGEREASDTWKELPIQNDRLQAGAFGLVDECQAALKEGRADSAALAAELALQLSEQGGSPGVDSIVESKRPLFERAFCACIGDMKSAPIRAIPSEDLAAHGFDHRAAFLMSRMDGTLSVSDLLDVAGMPRFDALRLVAALRRAQAVDLVPLA